MQSAGVVESEEGSPQWEAFSDALTEATELTTDLGERLSSLSQEKWTYGGIPTAGIPGLENTPFQSQVCEHECQKSLGGWLGCGGTCMVSSIRLGSAVRAAERRWLGE